VLYQLLAGRPPFVGPPEALMYKVVNEAPMPASTVEGGRGYTAFDAVVARALAKDPVERWPNGTAFREAISRAIAQPLPTAVSREAVYALPMPSDFAPTERIPTMHKPGTAAAPPTGTGATPTHWDPAALAKVEATLAKYVGPLAAVMVRRAARECLDVPSLYQRLGEQITQQSARDAFLHLVQGAGPGTGGSGAHAPGSTGHHRTAPPPTGGSGPTGVMSGGGPPVGDAWLEQAGRLMAGYVGPIAKVVVKRAADRTRQRDALCALLAEAVPEASRQKLLTELARIA
jgi:serine/threonine-protein kinase